MNVVLLYDLNEKTHAEQSRIIRVLFGFKDKSNHGKYSYERAGSLSKVPLVRKTKTALIVKEKYEVEVIQSLKRAGVKFMRLTPERKK